MFHPFFDPNIFTLLLLMFVQDIFMLMTSVVTGEPVYIWKKFKLLFFYF